MRKFKKTNGRGCRSFFIDVLFSGVDRANDRPVHRRIRIPIRVLDGMAGIIEQANRRLTNVQSGARRRMILRLTTDKFATIRLDLAIRAQTKNRPEGLLLCNWSL
jgi:hypothetical protein